VAAKFLYAVRILLYDAHGAICLRFDVMATSTFGSKLPETSATYCS